ncbi:hypothetical protein DXG03_007123 [Asterophora parasitica]|uniref:Uncharacterized protein n=1 Tax=Asterophora parasitica TaxID=117018 RepID=A0A9P7KF13_9AGAR|nr:hypothetical protein DXG03_007123 [Asterophora parasitica]
MDVSATPRPGRSLNRQVVLDEDEYTEALSQIIARDFFPSLVHLDATNNYLDALHSRDPSLINASVRHLEHINSTPLPSSSRRAPYQTPSQTPYNFGPTDTPVPTRTPRGEPPTKRPRLNTELSLDAFQAQYTSEDNSSFTQILDEENRQRKDKWTWAWEAQRRVEGQRDRMVEARERMLIEAPPVTGVRETFVIEAPQVVGLIKDGRQGETDKEKGKEKERDGEATEEGKEVVLRDQAAVDTPEEDVMAPKKDTRSAGVDGWKFKARNSLMFPPDADESPYHPNTKLVNSSADPKVIKYGNTRLPEYEHSSSSTRGSSAPPSPTRSRIDAAITGTQCTCMPFDHTLPEHLLKHLHIDRPTSPANGDFSLVPNLPSPTASELGPTAVKQLMTWGTLNATPRIISSDDPAPSASTPFHIPAMTSREMISHRLSNKASKSLRTKAGLLGLGQGSRTPGIIPRTPAAGKRGDMAPPSWTPRRSEAAGNLTPAARRLLERTTMSAAASMRAEAMERSAGWEGSVGRKDKDLNRVRWTPTPSSVTRS